ncbi:hypothetical protein Hanom_Chr16g01453891 [Helianthus anomalus]
MSVPVINLEGFEFEELDSYSGPVQVKQEVNPKPAVTSKPTSSKAAAASKPSTASKPRSSSSRKRKEPDSPASSDVFSFENQGFSESNKFMTGFLNQVGILILYPAYTCWLYILNTHIDTCSPDCRVLSGWCSCTRIHAV